MAVRALYLQLPPELGGVRFGPFPGTCVLGSDPKRAQVVLDPSMGIFPVHATVTQTAGGTYTVAPGAKDAKLFLVPAGQTHTWPITGPVQAKVGDLVILGTVTGPRFQLQTDQPVAAAPGAAEVVQTARQSGEQGFLQSASQAMAGFGGTAGMTRASRPSSGIAGELQRQLIARSMARSGVMRTGYILWTRFRTGSLFPPYVIVSIGIAVIAALGTGTLSCSGLIYVFLDVLHLR
ncbi:MAG: hypothetical protein R3F59_24705 [Myxococcota bacterium]